MEQFMPHFCHSQTATMYKGYSKPYEAIHFKLHVGIRKNSLQWEE
jgi:hypothetical protein